MSFGASVDVPLSDQRHSARPIASIQELARWDAGCHTWVAGAIRGFVAPYMGSRRHTWDAVAADKEIEARWVRLFLLVGQACF